LEGKLHWVILQGFPFLSMVCSVIEDHWDIGCRRYALRLVREGLPCARKSMAKMVGGKILALPPTLGAGEEFSVCSLDTLVYHHDCGRMCWWLGGTVVIEVKSGGEDH